MTRTIKTAAKPLTHTASAPKSKPHAHKTPVEVVSELPAVSPPSIEPPEPREPLLPQAEAHRSTGKLGVLIDLLQRERGATLDEMTQATGWQAHSVRGAMSGALKRKRGLALTSVKGEHGRTYRITAPEPVQ